MAKKIFLTVIALLLLVSVAYRIWYVNSNARLPIYSQTAQGDAVSYGGVRYRVAGAELWEYCSFFGQDDELADFMDDEVLEGEQKILLVELQLGTDEGSSLSLDLPVQICHTCNWLDPMLLEFLNPDLMEGTFHSGDSIFLPYEIYRENLTTEQWEQVENQSMVYAVVLSVYPQKNQLMITDVVCMDRRDEEVE